MQQRVTPDQLHFIEQHQPARAAGGGQQTRGKTQALRGKLLDGDRGEDHPPLAGVLQATPQSRHRQRIAAPEADQFLRELRVPFPDLRVEQERGGEALVQAGRRGHRPAQQLRVRGPLHVQARGRLEEGGSVAAGDDGRFRRGAKDLHRVVQRRLLTHHHPTDRVAFGEHTRLQGTAQAAVELHGVDPVPGGHRRDRQLGRAGPGRGETRGLIREMQHARGQAHPVDLPGHLEEELVDQVHPGVRCAQAGCRLCRARRAGCRAGGMRAGSGNPRPACTRFTRCSGRTSSAPARSEPVPDEPARRSIRATA